ncbi:hypothetical protein [Pseudomonas sp. TCU-HL1]|uniref:hypothetical protein n=1 Tax=Pseudomonas sp. TCU-HL1 TaxID=1856685 RepID=UPI00083D8E5C|nr:hypothetical protein [Pseudomonas sp. TCU-HL1]AOE85937.1 TnsA endonuclease [Pseudomonas sp. TCU-HL1]
MDAQPRDGKGWLETTPAKKFSTGEFGKLITYFPSRKSSTMVPCESLLEADFCLYLEYLPPIRHYDRCPFRFLLKSESRTPRRYTPDFMAILDNGSTVLYEVKPDILHAEGRDREKIEQFQSMLAEHGYLLEVIVESRFRQPAIIKNLSHLYHSSFGYSDSGITQVVSRIAESPQQKISSRQLLAMPDPPSAPDIAAAIFFKRIHTNLKRFFDLDSILTLVSNHE